MKLNEIKLNEDKLNEMYEGISHGIKVRRSFNCMNLVKKSNKYFLNLEKCRACQNIPRKI